VQAGSVWAGCVHTLCFPGQRTHVPVQSQLDRTCSSPGKRLHSDAVQQSGPAKAKQGAKRSDVWPGVGLSAPPEGGRALGSPSPPQSLGGFQSSVAASSSGLEKKQQAGSWLLVAPRSSPSPASLAACGRQRAARQWHAWLCRARVVSRAACSQQPAVQHLAGFLPALKHLPARLAPGTSCHPRARCTQHLPRPGFEAPWKMGPGRRDGVCGEARSLPCPGVSPFPGAVAVGLRGCALPSRPAQALLQPTAAGRAGAGITGQAGQRGQGTE